jgi:hypothetical protein
MQQRNLENLETFVVNAVERRVLNPTGIRLQANVISAREIISGTITANELSANIILVDNVIKSKNYNGAINSDGIITARGNAGWAITHNGEAEFNNVNIRGNLTAGAGFYASSNTQIFANTGGFFSLGSNFAWNGNSLTINGNITLTNTNIGTFDNGDALTGGSLGGITIGPSYIASTDYDANNGFAIYSNGFADFNEVSVRGEITATSGSISDNFSIGSNVQIGGFANIGANASIGTSATIGGSLKIGNNVRVNNATADGSQTVFKVRGDTNANSNFSGKFQKLNGDDVLTIRDDGRVGVTGSFFVNDVQVTPSSYVTGGPYLPTAGGTISGTLTISNNLTVNDDVTFKSDANAASTVVMFESTNSVDDRVISTRANGFISAAYLPSGGSGGLIRRSAGFLYVETSTIRIKENIEYIDQSVIDIVKKLKPVMYTLKRDISDNDYTYALKQMNKEIGFITEDVETLQSEIGASLVSYDSATLGKFDYRTDSPPFSSDEDFEDIQPMMYKQNAILSLTVKAIQETSEKIDNLEARLQALEGV